MRSFIFISVAAAFVAGCSGSSQDSLTGYVEAETLYMAPQEAGVVGAVLVKEGDKVNAGDVLFRMQSDRIAYQAEQAAAAASAAEKRADEDGPLSKAVTEAQANLERLSLGQS